MINTTAIARALAANLAAQDIRIKHVQALDLIAAGAGLANRHVMAKLPAFPKVYRVNATLLTSTATALALHNLDRRAAIVEETIKLLQAHVVASKILELDTHNLKLKIADLDDPAIFLETQEGEAFIESICNDLYYTRYERWQNDGPLSLKDGNKLAETILDAKREGGSVQQAVAEHFQHGYSAHRFWYDSAQNDVETIIDEMISEIEEIDLELAAGIDKWDWINAIEQHVIDTMAERDKSSPSDMLGSYDRCEAIFLIKAEGYAIDEMVTSTKPWSEAGCLYIDRTLQHSLASLGYTVEEFRRLSNNKEPSDDLSRGIKRRRDPLVTPDQLREMIDNACSQYFLFAVYGVVPIDDVIGIDLEKPITFSSPSVATYNPFSGTFHEIRLKGPVTFSPNEGEMRCGSEGVSPDDICGLHLPAFHGNIANPAMPEIDERNIRVAA